MRYALRGPGSHLLGRPRRAAAAWAIERYSRQAADAGPDGVGAVATAALAAMRASVATRVGGPERFLAAVDRAFHAPNGTEILDGDVDVALRARVMRHLHVMNGTLGNYAAFWASIRPYLAPGAQLLDVAAGHGGFAIDAARRAEAEGLPLDIVATDIRSESLAMARQLAGRARVTFEVQDALNLRNRAPGSFDVVTSTQALHHFSPADIARLIADASQVARGATVLIDGARSVCAAMLVTAVGGLGFADAVWAHDTLASFRRFYVPEELEVIARLAVPGRAVESRWIPPGHCCVVVPAAAPRRHGKGAASWADAKA
jgi:2-polyprenyl-3-methyl-5-hydroxy-6-metoxy-1,4-benzoquinol methylase